MCKPLKGKGTTNEFLERDSIVYRKEDIKSAMEWMIQFHEEQIEFLISTLQENFWYPEDSHKYGKQEAVLMRILLRNIVSQYQAIMVIEEGLEDVI